MEKFLPLIFSLMCVGFSQAFVARAEKEAYQDDEPGQEPVRKPVENRGGLVESHPYLQGDLYEEIANLDLSANEARGQGSDESPSISMIESNTGRCSITDGGVVGLEFEIPLKSLSRDLTHSELVISLKDSDDAVSLLTSYVRGPPPPGKEIDEEASRDQPRLNNNWLVYDVSDILKAFDAVDQQSGTVTVSVQLVGLPIRNATVEFDACGKASTTPPTVFLYHDFPADLRQRLHGSQEGARRRRKRQSLAIGSRTPGDQGSACHLHQFTVDFHQIGMKWIIAPILFQINYCHGVCSPVVNQTDIRVRTPVRVSPHGKLIARAKAILPQSSSASLPSLSCVPVTYDIMNMIYIDRSSMVRVETFSNMVASNCGCA